MLATRGFSRGKKAAHCRSQTFIKLLPRNGSSLKSYSYISTQTYQPRKSAAFANLHISTGRCRHKGDVYQDASIGPWTSVGLKLHPNCSMTMQLKLNGSLSKKKEKPCGVFLVAGQVHLHLPPLRGRCVQCHWHWHQHWHLLQGCVPGNEFSHKHTFPPNYNKKWFPQKTNK